MNVRIEKLSDLIIEKWFKYQIPKYHPLQWSEVTKSTAHPPCRHACSDSRSWSDTACSWSRLCGKAASWTSSSPSQRPCQGISGKRLHHHEAAMDQCLSRLRQGWARSACSTPPHPHQQTPCEIEIKIWPMDWERGNLKLVSEGSFAGFAGEAWGVKVATLLYHLLRRENTPVAPKGENESGEESISFSEMASRCQLYPFDAPSDALTLSRSQNLQISPQLMGKAGQLKSVA